MGAAVVSERAASPGSIALPASPGRSGKKEKYGPDEGVRCTIVGDEEAKAEVLANMSPNYIPSDHVDFEPDQPTCFVTLGGGGMYQLPVGPLIRRGNSIHFDYYDRTGTKKALSMVFRDGLYRSGSKPGSHREAVLTETNTHVILTGNYVEEDQTQGIQIIVWPVENVRVLPSVATAEFLSSQRQVWHPPLHPVRGPLPDRPVLGEAIKGESFEMHHLAPAEPANMYADPNRSVKLKNLGFVSPPPADANCSCGKAATVVVAVMTLEGYFVSTEPFCNDCFKARQTRSSG